MKLQLKIFLWSLAAYVLSYVAFFAFVNESQADWSYWVYHGWVYGKFSLPTLTLIASTVASILTDNSRLKKRKMWISWGIVTTLVVVFLSHDSWRLYSIQDDAPMGIIPDFNIVFCAIVAGLLFSGFSAGNWMVQRFKQRNKHGQQVADDQLPARLRVESLMKTQPSTPKLERAVGRQ